VVADSSTVAGIMLIVIGALMLAIGVASWVGWLRSQEARNRPERPFAIGFLGGPGAIMLGAFMLGGSTTGRLESQPSEVALGTAALTLVTAAVVAWNWKPGWLEPPWVRRERDTRHLVLLEELRRHHGIGNGVPLSPSTEDDIPSGPYSLSGFDTQQSYDAREPTWSEDQCFPSESEALRAARNWLAGQGREAQVEILHFMANPEGEVVAGVVADVVAHVVAVVTQSGVERVD
jgi:hypothetical protein